MPNPSTTRRAGVLAATALFAATLSAAAPAAAADRVLTEDTVLYVDAKSTTLEAATTLGGQARADAQLLGSFPSATWFTGGTPAEVTVEVADLVADAATSAAVPVLVAYNLPFRDCAQYSAGGAADTAAYTAWVDAFAAGIGSRPAVVLLEPDGLGIIPWNTDLNGNAEWCRPAELDSATAAADRYEQLNHAVDVLAALPSTSVYLDGTHSNWLAVGDISDRLIRAGVERADGFFVNASNYVATERLQKYGRWISDCIRLSQNSWYEPAYCGSQYYPANPADFATWGLTDAAYDQAYADTGVARDPATQPHFVIDTSRNGQGPWTPPAGKYTDAEDWCNPPGRGLGAPPSTDTGDPLLDAYLWIKVPGESDGRCFRGTAGPTDPERGIVDPEAGGWFVEQARELISFASPALAAQTCDVRYTPRITAFGRFLTQVTVTNRSAVAVSGWTLGWRFHGDESVQRALGARASQSGDALTATNVSANRVVKPGRSVDFVIYGKGTTPRDEPWQFRLNGAPCTSS